MPERKKSSEENPVFPSSLFTFARRHFSPFAAQKLWLCVCKLHSDTSDVDTCNGDIFHSQFWFDGLFFVCFWFFSCEMNFLRGKKRWGFFFWRIVTHSHGHGCRCMGYLWWLPFFWPCNSQPTRLPTVGQCKCPSTRTDCHTENGRYHSW